RANPAACESELGLKRSSGDNPTIRLASDSNSVK
ncbi:hypothetical protein A2U01_0090976, partial [Trifolium medium]|nr:hypothetical protein [Trifolium medium]